MHEAELLHGLHHPNVVSLLGVVKDDLWGHGLVTEYLPGGDLHRLATRPIPLASVIKVARDIAAGMTLLHMQRVQHKDLTSRNVFLDRIMDGDN